MSGSARGGAGHGTGSSTGSSARGKGADRGGAADRAAADYGAGVGASTIARVGRGAAYVGLFALGCAAGFIGAFAQAAYSPAGLLIALAGSAGLFVAGGLLMRGKAGAAVPAAGWLIMVFYIAAAPRAEGDWVFSGGVGSYLFLLGGSIVGAMIAMQPWGGSAGPLLLSGERLPGRGK